MSETAWRFMLDHMVIKLGKYLRVLGYDAVWDRAHRTHELIEAANRDERVFLTRNSRLGAEYPRPARVLILRSDDPVEQLYEVHRALGLDLGRRLFGRCIRCNLDLEPVADKSAIRDRVHPNVWRGYEAFFTCPGCGTVFWKGSHVRNTCAKLRLSDISERPRTGGVDRNRPTHAE